MALPANWKTMRDRPIEERKALTRKGGLRSVEVRREKRNLKQQLKLLLEIKDKDGLTNHEKACLALLKKVLTGDTKAFEVLRDTIGEKPVDKVSNRIGASKNGGLKIILLGEDNAKKQRNCHSIESEAKQDTETS